MLIFQLICLGITLAVLEYYVITGFHAKSHRFLPLVLGLIGLYDFYLIVEYITGQTEVFTVLKDLLFMQMIYLILHYIMDFMVMKLPFWGEMIIAISWMAATAAVLLDVSTKRKYGELFLIFMAVYCIIIMAVSTMAYLKYSYSKENQKVYKLLYLSILIPAIAFVLHLASIGEDTIIMPIAWACTCLIIQYLLGKRQLLDTNGLLQEEYFQTADIPLAAFDADFYFLKANDKSKELFRDYVEALEKMPMEYSFKNSVRAICLEKESPPEIKIADKYYICHAQKAYYRDTLRGYILSLTDITLQKEQAKQMEQQVEQAEQENKEKSVFLAQMSHELRSPLHAIIGGSDIVLTRNEMSLKCRSMVLHIRKAGEDLLKLVNAILDYSKLDAGKLELRKDRYSFQKLVKEQAHMCYVNLQKKPIEFQMNIVTEYPDFVIGDEMRVREILQNILSNAVKFTEEGYIHCEISVTPSEDGRVFIEIKAQDSGVGMNQEQLANIFGEYVSYSDFQAKEGTGLGLNIIKQLAEMMGGTAKAESDGVSGSTITLSFYQDCILEDSKSNWKEAHIFTMEDLEEDQEEWNNKIVPKWSYKKARVLLADDMEVNRIIFKNLSEQWQFQIDEAEDGLQALEAAKNKDYHLIILDQMMPNMDGIEAAEKIREFSQVPIVMLTADISDGMKEKAASHGFSAYLSKPIEAEQFQNVIETLLPEELREDFKEIPNFSAGSSLGKEAYYRVLNSYKRELQEIIEHLKEYMNSDINMYRTKVHGVKGTSRQIGKIRLSENAEVMEMAAKLENRAFIERHIDEFMGDLEIGLEEVEEELFHYHVKTDDNDTAFEESDSIDSAVDVDGLWKMLKAALDSYDMNEIEAVLKQLEHVIKDDKRDMLMQVKDAYEQFEYEKACELIEV